MQAGDALSNAELSAAANGALGKAGAPVPRRLVSSETVQREMQPALSELKSLAYVVMSLTLRLA